MTLVLLDFGGCGTDVCWFPREGRVSSLLFLGVDGPSAAAGVGFASGMTSEDGGLHRPEALEGCGAASRIPCGKAGIAESRKQTATESCAAIRAGKRIGSKLSTSSAPTEFALAAARSTVASLIVALEMGVG